MIQTLLSRRWRLFATPDAWRDELGEFFGKNARGDARAFTDSDLATLAKRAGDKRLSLWDRIRSEVIRGVVYRRGGKSAFPSAIRVLLATGDVETVPLSSDATKLLTEIGNFRVYHVDGSLYADIRIR